MVPLTAHAGQDLPVKGGTVTSGIGWRLDPFGSGKMLYHRGVDIAVPLGTAVHATTAGRVVYSGLRGGYGKTVIVEDRHGDRFIYGHNSVVEVKRGDEVTAGDVIALSGSSGRSTGPHVHYEIEARGHAVTEVAEADESSPAPKIDQRAQKEQLLEDTMNSLLEKINATASPYSRGG